MFLFCLINKDLKTLVDFLVRCINFWASLLFILTWLISCTFIWTLSINLNELLQMGWEPKWIETNTWNWVQKLGFDVKHKIWFQTWRRNYRLEFELDFNRNNNHWFHWFIEFENILKFIDLAWLRIMGHKSKYSEK